MADDTSQWITVKDAQDYLAKSERTVRRWIQRNKIPSKKSADGTVLVDVSVFERVGTPDTSKPEPDVTEPESGTPEPEPAETASYSLLDIKRLESKISVLEAENKLLIDERNYLRERLEDSIRDMMAAQQNLIEGAVTTGDTSDDTSDVGFVRRLWRAIF